MSRHSSTSSDPSGDDGDIGRRSQLLARNKSSGQNLLDSVLYLQQVGFNVADTSNIPRCVAKGPASDESGMQTNLHSPPQMNFHQYFNYRHWIPLNFHQVNLNAGNRLSSFSHDFLHGLHRRNCRLPLLTLKVVNVQHAGSFIHLHETNSFVAGPCRYRQRCCSAFVGSFKKPAKLCATYWMSGLSGATQLCPTI